MGGMFELFFRVFLFLSTTGSSLGIDKYWLPDLEWQTGNNWVGGLLPDADSRVIFPEQTWHAVGLPNPGNLEVAEIYLPREGSLYLGKNGILQFSGTKKTIRNARWARKGIYMWTDPDNWNGYTAATPHSERIPCDSDVAVLPSRNRTLSIGLPEVEVHVQGVRISDDNTTLTRWEWRDLSDEPGFSKSHLTVTYVGIQLCDDCTCHGEFGESISAEVCSFMWQERKCGPAVCEDPLKVEGHCCDYCGGRIALSGKASLRKVESRVNAALGNYRGVITWYVRKTWNGNSEVLIAEDGTYSGINSQEAVDSLSKILIGEGFDVLESRATGFALVSTPLATTLGPLLGIPIIIVLLLLVAFPYFGYSYSQVFSGWREACSSIRESGRSEATPKSTGFFGFARFENIAEGDVCLAEAAHSAEEIVEEDSDVDGPSSSGKRFENPLYRSKRNVPKTNTDQPQKSVDERIIDIDGPMSLTALESKVEENTIDEVKLD